MKIHGLAMRLNGRTGDYNLKSFVKHPSLNTQQRAIIFTSLVATFKSTMINNWNQLWKMCLMTLSMMIKLLFVHVGHIFQHEINQNTKQDRGWKSYCDKDQLEEEQSFASGKSWRFSSSSKHVTKVVMIVDSQLVITNKLIWIKKSHTMQVPIYLLRVVWLLSVWFWQQDTPCWIQRNINKNHLMTTQRPKICMAFNSWSCGLFKRLCHLWQVEWKIFYQSLKTQGNDKYYN